MAILVETAAHGGTGLSNQMFLGPSFSCCCVFCYGSAVVGTSGF